jgi:hypothetical protein
MALIKGRFIDPSEAIKLNADPVALVDVARKNYVDTQVAATTRIPHKQINTLTLIDISNGYIDLSKLAITDSTSVHTGGVELMETDEYITSTVSGITRITFAPAILALLSAGDKVYTKYWSLT